MKHMGQDQRDGRLSMLVLRSESLLVIRGTLCRNTYGHNERSMGDSAQAALCETPPCDGRFRSVLQSACPQGRLWLRGIRAARKISGYTMAGPHIA